MSVHTIIRDGVVEKFKYPVTVWDLDDERWHHNPSICRDNTGKIWISTRHHQEKPAVRYANPEPYSHPTSWLMVGTLEETPRLKVVDVKRIKPDVSCPIYIQEKEIEDVRIFWRKDGLHGIGAAIDAHSYAGETRISQVEILIDYKKGTYKLLKDYGYIKGHMEKNWSPPSEWTKYFDYIYSPTQVVLENKVYGAEYDGHTHGGSQAIPYKDGWIRLAHQVMNMPGLTHRWYVSVAELINEKGYVTHNSQFFDMCTGWRPQIRESVEFISGMVWSKGKEGKELLVSYGLRDETCAFIKIPVDAFKWSPVETNVQYYTFRFNDSKPPISPSCWVGGKFSGSVYGR